jgi:hypothetical protein
VVAQDAPPSLSALPATLLTSSNYREHRVYVKQATIINPQIQPATAAQRPLVVVYSVLQQLSAHNVSTLLASLTTHVSAQLQISTTTRLKQHASTVTPPV